MSYLTCGPLFIISGNIYAAKLKENKDKLKDEGIKRSEAS